MAPPLMTWSPPRIPMPKAELPSVQSFCDLHNHLLHGLDDGAKTLADSLEMGRALVSLGFTEVAPSPHARPEYASAALARARLAEVQAAFDAAQLPLTLHLSAENSFLEPTLLPHAGTPEGRPIGAGPYLLVEAPYLDPVPALPQIVFRLKLKGVTALIAHPERCAEFQRPGRAAEIVGGGARLQLDVAALMGRYGPVALKYARLFLDEGLYSVAATDLHSPVGAREWVGKAMEKLKAHVGDTRLVQLFAVNPRRVLNGEALEL